MQWISRECKAKYKGITAEVEKMQRKIQMKCYGLLGNCKAKYKWNPRHFQAHCKVNHNANASDLTAEYTADCKGNAKGFAVKHKVKHEGSAKVFSGEHKAKRNEMLAVLS